VSVSKNKFTSFHLGLVLQMFWFFVCSTFHRCSTQKSCGYTWGLYLVVLMVGDISQFTICVARFLISHVRFYPPFTLLLDVTQPLFFSELGKNMFTKS
jgi:ABC-type Co2+ transport system permease subunit